MKRLLLAALALLFVLHNDLWWWHDADRWLELPVGLAFHLLLCFAASLVFWGLSRYLPSDPREVIGSAAAPETRVPGGESSR